MSEESTLPEEEARVDSTVDGFEQPNIPADDSSDAAEASFAEEPVDEPEAGVHESVKETSAKDEGDSLFSDQILSDAGVTLEQATDQYGTPERLQTLLDNFDRNMASQGQQFLGQRQAQQQEPKEWGLPDVELPEEYSDQEDTQFLVKHLNDHISTNLAPQFHQQQELINSLMAERQSQVFQNYVNDFDRGLEGLGPEWESVFGKGKAIEVAASSLQGQNRQHLDATMANISQGLASSGMPSLSISDLQRRAVRVAFPQHHDQTVTQVAQAKVAKRHGQFTNTPTRAGEQGSTPETRAAAKANDVLKRMGIAYNDSDVPGEEYTGMEV